MKRCTLALSLLAEVGPVAREGRSMERAFAPLPPVSLADLVPSNHFYRHLERTLDLSFVRDLVRTVYAGIGRPSIDPVVFFKLQLIRLSLRWYLDYDLTEPLPRRSPRPLCRT